MNLIKHEIPESQLVWIQANRQKKISELEYADFNNGMEAILAKAQASLGYATDFKVKKFIITELFAFLRKSKLSNGITIQEIGLFVDNGILGKYQLPKNYLNSINYQNIAFWIQEGVKDEERKNALVYEANQQMEFIAKERTPEEIEALMKVGLASCIEFVRKGSSDIFKPPFKHVHDYLNDKYGVEVERGGVKKKTLIPDHSEALELTKIAKAKFEKNKSMVSKKADYTDLANMWKWEHSYELYCKEEYCKRFIEKAVKEGRGI